MSSTALRRVSGYPKWSLAAGGDAGRPGIASHPPANRWLPSPATERVESGKLRASVKPNANPESGNPSTHLHACADNPDQALLQVILT